MIAPTVVLLRLGLAALLGCLIGIERERLIWAAGLRTHMLVSVGSTLFMLVSSFGFADILGTENVSLDPSRIAAQVVSGIGFLGAGTILLRHNVIRGLTTAASLWSVAAIGLAVGGGLYVAAISATVLILIILAGIKPLERRFRAPRRLRTIVMISDRRAVSLAALEHRLTHATIKVQQISLHQGDELDSDEIRITLKHTNATSSYLLSISDDLRNLPGVRMLTIQEL